MITAMVYPTNEEQLCINKGRSIPPQAPARTGGLITKTGPGPVSLLAPYVRQSLQKIKRPDMAHRSTPPLKNGMDLFWQLLLYGH